MNKSWKASLSLLISFSLFACDNGSDLRKIDLNKSEQIIEYIDHLNITSLVLNDQNLIINDSLVLINPDSLINPMFHQHQLGSEDWESERRLPAGTLAKVLSLINKSSNKRILKEKQAYFFHEGGWIDSDFGKVYSKRQLEGKGKEFTFDRVQEIKPFGEKENWYIYYAD